MGTSQRAARAIFDAALVAVDPFTAVKRNFVFDSQSLRLFARGKQLLPDFSARHFDRALIVGAGKASCEMATAVADVLQPSGVPLSGFIVAKRGHVSNEMRSRLNSYQVRVEEGDHPVPTEAGATATRELLSLLRRHASPRTLVVWCASGGGSALTGGVGAAEYLTVDVLARTTSWLLASGAPIESINAVRKHLCAAHAGRAAVAAYPSKIVTLAVSDVMGGALHTIAGGPTTADPTTLEECRAILHRLGGHRERDQGGLPDRCVRDAFWGSDPKQLLEETPKVLDPEFVVEGVIVAELKDALIAAKEKATEILRGVSDSSPAPLVLTSRLSGEASQVGKVMASIAMDPPFPPDQPFILLAGGETTVTMQLDSAGLGGRSQEMALAAGLDLATYAPDSDACVLCAGTDGTDGPTDADGAVVSSSMFLNNEELYSKALESLGNHDSYRFFRDSLPEAHIKTGPTGTNVGDLCVIVRGFQG